jgi:hypothetical protein
MGADKILQLLGDYRALNKLKLTVEVTSINYNNTNRIKIKTISVFDIRKQKYWTKEQIAKRGIENFLSLLDMKETLNWNLNGDSSLYYFKRIKRSGITFKGKAFIFD